MPPNAPIVESYDRYYGSGLVTPSLTWPNPPTYRSALRLARTSSPAYSISAREAAAMVAVLDATNAFVCAYDISAHVCGKALELQAATADVGSQRLLVAPTLICTSSRSV